jgi:hypothetical protein
MRVVQIIAGDKDIKDLSPAGLNIGGRIVKNMRIAGSGIYQYHRREAALFGLDPSFLPGDQEYFYMYRPPEVLDRNKKLFARVPIITGRHVIVDQDNAKELSVGMVGDQVESEVSADDGELYLYTTGTIVAGDGIEAYEKYGQLSVGYSPKCEWRRGTHQGTRYDAVLLDFKDVNHLLICPEARGGPQCVIMDSLDYFPSESKIMHSGGTKMSLLGKFFKKKNDIAGDARVPILLQSIAVGADPTTQVTAIKAITDKMKIAGDAKTTWDGYLAELSGCKDEAAETKVAAIAEVTKFWATVAGDSVGSPDMPDDANTSESGKPDDKQESGTGDSGGAETGKEAETKEEPAPGDAKFEERFNKIESSIGQLTQAVGQLVAKNVSTAGDQKGSDEQGKEPGASTMTLENTAGDSKGTNKKQTVSDFMADLRG